VDKSPIVIGLIAQADVEDARIISGFQISVSRQDQSENSLAQQVDSNHRGPPDLDGEPTGASDQSIWRQI
jgi:hypothetical protein